ncbi:MAG TPA: lysylphosphatidylglycerol synthase transmembrane domain-containing protein, partial [Acidimicrobiia bacterium]|nr:lysylphosphatidylglycerol synthase transmembrane domain-containing protein [Acidimicrobiia bacterium]
MTEAAPLPRRTGSKWPRLGPRSKVALRIVVSGLLLALVVSKASDAGDAIPDDHHVLTVVLLAGAVLTALVGVVLSAWRWQRVLRLFDARVRLTALFSHYVVGLLVGNVLPSTIGGDVVRVARASNTVGSSTVSFGSVVLERLTGFVALPLLVFAGFAIRPSLLEHDHAWIALLIALATLALLAMILFVVGHPRLAGRFADRDNWSRFIGAVHIGVERLRREPRQITPVLGTALIFQISQIVMFGLIFRALDLSVPVAAVVAFAPAVLMLQVLPISFSGLGVREGALVLFLHSFDVSNAQAVAAGLLWWGCMIAVSMLGAPA